MFKKHFNQIILVLLALASLAVFITSFFTSIYYDMHVDVDFPHYKKETISHLLISMAFVFVVFFLMYKKNLLKNNKFFIVVSISFCVAYCMLLILAIKPLPVDDSKLIDDVLLQIEEGNYSSLIGKGGYLYIWPFQLGYVLFGQMMDAVFGHGNYFAWDVVQLFSILITVFVLYKITWELFEDKVICSIMALMSTGMLFFYNYVTFIYGDILSMAPQTLALYLTILYVKREKIRYVPLIALFIGMAVVLKTNCEITLIAITIILLFSTTKDRSTENGYRAYEIQGRFLVRMAVVAGIALFVFGCRTAVDLHYCKAAGIDAIPTGSPSVSHIAMGLQESELEDGWYNRYNYDVFAENDYDTAKTRQAALLNLKERLSYFAENPKYAARYMIRKFLTQWADSVCISTHNLDLVSRHVENPTTMMYYIVFGTGNVILRWIMNVYMSVCYLGVLVYLFYRIKKRNVSLSEMLLLVLIFGGMCFHQFWEGSSRYVMRYYVYWVPYAAFGIKELLKAADNLKFLKRKV